MSDDERESTDLDEVNGEFERLLAEAALGSEKALHMLTDRYTKQVRIVARVLLGPQLRQHFDSMDLLQSVHRSVVIGLRQERYQFSSPDKLIALACSILRRKVAKKWRHYRRQISLGTTPTGDPISLTDLLSSITNHETNPALIAQFDDQLLQLCNQLSESERLMLEMRLDGFSNQEVAEKLDLHPVALRVRWTRLRQRLSAIGIHEDLI